MMKLIVGLGNPGKEYERTRHNVGFLIADAIISNFQFPISKLDKKMNAIISKGEIAGKRTTVAMPQTFMNNSGVAVEALLHFYKLEPNALIVIHDDKDILLGEFRIQKNRGAAGHNGVLSIIEHVRTKDFTRIRVGVAPQDKIIHDTTDFVLGKFTKEEQRVLKNVIDQVVEEIHKLIL